MTKTRPFHYRFAAFPRERERDNNRARLARGAESESPCRPAGPCRPVRGKNRTNPAYARKIAKTERVNGVTAGRGGGGRAIRITR